MNERANPDKKWGQSERKGQMGDSGGKIDKSEEGCWKEEVCQGLSGPKIDSILDFTAELDVKSSILKGLFKPSPTHPFL